MYRIEISQMLARGKKGWIKNSKGEFLKQKSQSNYGSSHQKLLFELEDGIYQVQDANYGSSRARTYWLKIENGEATEIEPPSTLGDLPSLEGSEKQVSWAINIRQKTIAQVPKEYQNAAIAIISSACFGEGSYSAKWWIDHRDNAIATIKSAIKKALKSGYPTQEWVEYEAEYAHEGYGGRYRYMFEGSEWFLGADEFLEIGIFRNPETEDLEVWYQVVDI